MIIAQEYDYRNALAVIEAVAPGLREEVHRILTNSSNKLDLAVAHGRKQRDLSRQVQNWFCKEGWEDEYKVRAIPEMAYDLHKQGIPLEIELGHQRLVFPDFFKFMADFAKGNIAAAMMIVTGCPTNFGKDWHCSLESTKRKIHAVREVFPVPLLVIAVDP